MADNNPHGICFAPDGKSLFAGGSGENHVTVWEAATGKLVRRFEAAKGGHLVLAITPDGKTLAATDAWGACRLWDVASGKPLRSLEGCREQLVALAFSPDGKTLVAASRDESVHFWDVETGKERHVFPAHVYLLTSVVFTADGKGLFTSGFDGTVRQWDAETGRHLRQLAKADEFVMQLALSSDGTTLAAGTSANFSKMRLRDGAHLVRLWDLKSGRALEPLKGFEGSVGSIAFSPDGELLASRDDNGFVRIWDTATWKERTRIHELKKEASWANVIFSPDSRCIATAKHNQKPGGQNAQPQKRYQELGLWDAATARQVRRFIPLQEDIRLFAFTPDGRTLIAAGFTQPIRYWETATGKVRFELGNNEKEHISALANSPDGRTIAVASYNHPICLWDSTTGQKLAELESGSSTRGVESLAFSRDGRRLASAESDSTAIVWDVAAVTRRAKPQAAVAEEQLDALWQDLIGNDAAKAFRALAKLAATPAQAVPLVRKKLKAKPEADAERIRQWLADLDSDQFAKREEATKNLEALGDLAEPALRKALENPPSAEVRRRIEKLLATRNEQGLSGDSLKAVRAVEVLEYIATPEARELLQKLAAGAPEARLTREAKPALERLRSYPLAHE
jgi:WD40 repeat protein